MFIKTQKNPGRNLGTAFCQTASGLCAGNLPGGSVNEVIIGIGFDQPERGQGKGRGRALEGVDTADSGDAAADDAGTAAIIQKTDQSAGAGELIAVFQLSVLQTDMGAADSDKISSLKGHGNTAVADGNTGYVLRTGDSSGIA